MVCCGHPVGRGNTRGRAAGSFSLKLLTGWERTFTQKEGVHIAQARTIDSFLKENNRIQKTIDNLFLLLPLLLLLLALHSKPIQPDHIEHDVHQHGQQRVRGKPQPRRIHEPVIPAIQPHPDPQTRCIEPQQRRHEAPHRARQILRLTPPFQTHSQRTHRSAEHPQPHKTPRTRHYPHIPHLSSLLPRKPVQHRLRRLIPRRSERQPAPSAPHGQQRRVVLHAHQRHLLRHALELERHAEIAGLACR